MFIQFFYYSANYRDFLESQLIKIYTDYLTFCKLVEIRFYNWLELGMAASNILQYSADIFFVYITLRVL